MTTTIKVRKRDAKSNPHGQKNTARLRGISRHRAYTVAEIAERLHVAKGTVRRWMKAGLESVDGEKPALISGETLIAFRQDKRRTKQHCQPHECYCFRCRTPRAPALAMADYVPVTTTRGNLVALCEECGTTINKLVSRAKLEALEAILEVSIRPGPIPINDISSPSLNDHLKTEA